jgi:hypothetical protein
MRRLAVDRGRWKEFAVSHHGEEKEEEFERMWKPSGVAYFKIQAQHLHVEPEINYEKAQQNIVVQWLTPLLLIWKSWVQISARRPAIPTDVFRVFPQSLQANAGYYLKLGHVRFLPHPFPFIIHLSFFNSTLYVMRS